MILQILLFISCSSNQFDLEKQRYNEYLSAITAQQSGDISKAINILENLHNKDEKSRAILERLLYLYLESDYYFKGLTIANSYLQKHPGDTEIRLVRSKLLLKNKEYSKSAQDIQILLHGFQYKGVEFNTKQIPMHKSGRIPTDPSMADAKEYEEGDDWSDDMDDQEVSDYWGEEVPQHVIDEALADDARQRARDLRQMEMYDDEMWNWSGLR